MSTQKLRILVIDDNPIHQESARQTLEGHDLTIVGTYDEACQKLQKPYPNYREVSAALDKLHPKKVADMNEEERKMRDTDQERLMKEFTPPPPYDVVLSDLLMPASKEAMVDEGDKFVGQEMPVGFALALYAVLQGAKHIAVVTATNHHKHPASAWIDRLSGSYWDEYSARNGVFNINGAQVGYFHTPFVKKVTQDVPCYACKQSPGVCKNCNGTGINKDPNWHPKECHSCSHTDTVGKCTVCKGAGRYDKVEDTAAKDWGKVLARLLGTD